jgi:hypothetical protein
MKKYTVEDIGNSGSRYRTKDGRYKAIPDEKGYLYWYDGNYKMGNGAYDYFFNLERGVIVLNRLIDRYAKLLTREGKEV